MNPEMNSNHDQWQSFNHDYVQSLLLTLYESLEKSKKNISNEKAEANATVNTGWTLPAPPSTLPLPAFEVLCQTFRLSAFERSLLLLCIGVELDTGLAELCAQAQRQPHKYYPTLELAFNLWGRQPALCLLAPDSPLRQWDLIRLLDKKSSLLSPLIVTESILHYALGKDVADSALARFVEPLVGSAVEIPSHQALTRQIEQIGFNPTSNPDQSPLMINLYGQDLSGSLNVVRLLARCQEKPIYQIDLAGMLASFHRREQGQDCAHLLLRKALLNKRLYMLVVNEQTVLDAPIRSAIAHLAKRLHRHCLLVTSERFYLSDQPILQLAIPRLTRSEQINLWRTQLSQVDPHFLAELVDYYDLKLSQIQIISQVIAAEVREKSISDLPARLRRVCSEQARQQLGGLAQLIEPKADWEDLVLPPTQKQLLQQMTLQVAQRYKVYDDWGFAEKGGRGLGISALFAGPSGTGKTLATEVMAKQLQVDVYHIDLSAVVSKYIGETEKNLKHVFDMAEGSGAILLFDEADALFGKRTQVRDSHDRYANLEVSFLLQRMEAYRGLSILTTNLKSALDSAFLRRLRFVVDFPFPDTEQRQQLWQQAFPAGVPQQNLAFDKLARLYLVGGHIRNIALNAAFFAAGSHSPVTMRHILQATQQEYQKLGQALSPTEIADW